MNAFYAAFKSIQTYQKERSRTHWLQLGWLYVDSGSILSKYLGEGETLETCHAATDIDTVLNLIKECGSKLAAVVVECPSNPLIKSCDLARIAAVIKAQGGLLLLDPTIASVYAIDVLPYADTVVTSLTKYAAHSADVMAGAVVLNAKSPHFAGLQSRVQSWCIPHYERDLARLASNLETAPKVLALMQRNAKHLIEFFKQHPAVKQVHCAEGLNYQTIAKNPDASVPLFSVVLNGSMERFYDAVTLMKGPSFGARSTLLCPFMYLAHYDLVTNEAGREKLRAAGIEPDLIRIAVGTEPYQALEAVFAAALEASLA
jgi:cystathionine gamma-synthase